MPTAFQITDWHTLYEFGDFKKTRHAAWYPKRTKHDGKGYKKLMRMKGGHLHYLAFTLLEQVAAKCEVRGLLADSHGPLLASDLELITEAPASIFENAFTPLCEVGWLTKIDIPKTPMSESVGEIPRASEVVGEIPSTNKTNNTDRTIQDKTGQTGHRASEPEVLTDPHSEFCNEWNELGTPFPKIASWSDKRKKAFKARMEDSYFRDNWRTAFAKLQDSEFCKGKNDRGWIADVDFFLSPDSVVKIMEGKYDGKNKRAPPQPAFDWAAHTTMQQHAQKLKDAAKEKDIAQAQQFVKDQGNENGVPI